MKDRALVVAPLPACVGEGRDEVRGEGWNSVHFVHTPCSRNCRDLNHSGEGRTACVRMFAIGKAHDGVGECGVISKPVKERATGQNQNSGHGLREEVAGQPDRTPDKWRTTGPFCGRPGRTAAFIVDQVRWLVVNGWWTGWTQSGQGRGYSGTLAATRSTTRRPRTIHSRLVSHYHRQQPDVPCPH